ncbi:glycosyltransferase family 61 protein [Paenibacillus sp. NPDC058071]|uniref:glycosyltransferase family 61 protein n=1 Tax=Paenibacillus sp. NPDC058071 TaxID=3346326 RepID=UPI0036DCD83B
MYTVPNEFHEKLIDWAKATFPPSVLPQFYKPVYPAEIVTLPGIRGIDPPRWAQICGFEEAYAAIIPKGRVATSNCYVITPDNKRVRDVEYDCPFFTNAKLPDPVYTDKTVATVLWGWNIPGSRTHNVFGHWFFDILPRFHLLERSGIPIDYYLIGKLEHPFQYESLQMLGIPQEKLIEVERLDFHLIAEQLVVPAVPVMVGKCPPWASRYITAKLKHEQSIPKAEGYERIYITRQDAAARFVVNEDEVLQYLSAKGFRKILLTPLTTEQKVSIFSAARIIVAPYGSGSANVAFCEPGASLFELSPNNLADNYFWKLCGHAGVHYHEILCEVEQPPKAVLGSDNLIVNMNKLKQVLSLSGI